MSSNRITCIAHKNTGTPDDYPEATNQCMLISILNYINYCLRINITFFMFRNEYCSSGMDVNNINEPYDNDKHKNALEFLLKRYNIRIQIFYYNTPINSPAWISNNFQYEIGNNNAKYVIPIVAYGEHFELIIKMPNFDISSFFPGINKEFEPDLNLAIGNNNTPINNYWQTTLNKINEELVKIQSDYGEYYLNSTSDFLTKEESNYFIE